jgi:sulfur carrier protein ThiS adenylyltransferase
LVQPGLTTDSESKSDSPDLTDRDIRQRDILTRDALAAVHIVLIGVGAVGRQVALQLAAIGFPNVDIFDPDTVGVENLAPQGYRPDQINLNKVAATKEDCHAINDIVLDGWGGEAERFRGSSFEKFREERPDTRSCVICCVDSIEDRAHIYRSLWGKTDFFVDARLGGPFSIRVLCEDYPKEDGPYSKTLFTPEEAYQEGCTTKTTIFAAFIAAGLMVSQVASWVRQMPVVLDTGILNLLSMELVEVDPVEAVESGEPVAG